MLWLELKKLAARGLRLAACSGLVMVVLAYSLGIVVVLDNRASLDRAGAKIVHLQALGGLLHLHDGSQPGHQSPPASTPPPGVYQYVLARSELLAGPLVMAAGPAFERAGHETGLPSAPGGRAALEAAGFGLDAPLLQRRIPPANLLRPATLYPDVPHPPPILYVN